MVNLAEFDINRNPLGNNATALLNALSEIHNLRYLDLSGCSISSASELGYVLGNNSGLEILYLQNNMLANISALLPYISQLKLQKLKFGGNDLTTAERIAVNVIAPNLKAIPLDEDTAFTQWFFAQVSPSTEYLDLSELCPTDPTALVTVMPQLANFPNLKGLNFARNAIGKFNIHSGLRAFADYLKLPEAGNLQYLNFSNSLMDYHLLIGAPDALSLFEAIGQLEQLTVLDLQNTFVNGSFLTEIFPQMSALTYLDLASSLFDNTKSGNWAQQLRVLYKSCLFRFI